ncbi:histidine kinase [Aurantibacter sp.]|uniref:histidine kinase n=1 Tax=Aurantibacter sp. TaxID=2807103 RepID=UPI0035C865A0
MKKAAITFLIGTIVFLIGAMFFEEYTFNNVSHLIFHFSMYQLYAFLLGYSNMAYFSYLEGRNWKKRDWLKRILIGITGSVVITLIGLFILRAFSSIIINGEAVTYFLKNESFRNYQFGLWITLTVVVTFHIIYFYNKSQQNKIKEQKVIAGTASAKFDALKNQLDPHFLFNSLNVLNSLIEENPENAQQFTTALSKVYRYVLEQKNKDLVTVDEELKFAKTYMTLLKMRFEDSLIFEIPEKAQNPESKVVPLSLQLLLENAVKHNIVTSTKPLKIIIKEQDNSIVVQNNLQIKQILNKSSGVGLSNIVQRYRLLTNRKIEINATKTHFIATIPLLTKQINIMEVNTGFSEQMAYTQAKKEVEKIKGFYGNAISYSFVIPFLIFINLRYSPEFYWFFFPMFGWGMGLAFHALEVFGYGKSWEDKKIKEIMEKVKSNQLNTWK